jgi:hypothetical protein
MQPGSGKAILILFRELGFWKAVITLFRLVKAESKGEPFGHLDPADSEEERLSRKQIGPGIILYKELRKVVSQERAIDIAEQAIIAGAIAFLKRSIGPLRKDKLESLNDTQRRAFVEEKGKRFFNATITWDTIEPTKVAFTVTSCRFPRLCKDAGVPELAPSFCRGDATFFGNVEPNVQLDRPQMISTGAPTCQFALQWIDTPPTKQDE